eukprot:jgi/Chlat1/6295/Chrsp44S05877
MWARALSTAGGEGQNVLQLAGRSYRNKGRMKTVSMNDAVVVRSAQDPGSKASSRGDTPLLFQGAARRKSWQGPSALNNARGPPSASSSWAGQLEVEDVEDAGSSGAHTRARAQEVHNKRSSDVNSHPIRGHSHHHGVSNSYKHNNYNSADDEHRNVNNWEIPMDHISLSDYMAALVTTPAPESLSSARSSRHGPHSRVPSHGLGNELDGLISSRHVEEDEDEKAVTLSSVPSAYSSASLNTADLRPATSSVDTARMQDGCIDARSASTKETDLSALAAELFSPAFKPNVDDDNDVDDDVGNVGNVGNAAVAGVDQSTSLLKAFYAQRRRGSAPGRLHTVECEGSSNRPPSRQRPPPEALHLFTEGLSFLPPGSKPHTHSSSSTHSRKQPRPETAPLQGGITRPPLVGAGGGPPFSQQQQQQQQSSTVHQRFPRPPSRQRPPPEAVELGSPPTRMQALREIVGGNSESESP